MVSDAYAACLYGTQVGRHAQWRGVGRPLSTCNGPSLKPKRTEAHVVIHLIKTEPVVHAWVVDVTGSAVVHTAVHHATGLVDHVVGSEGLLVEDVNAVWCADRIGSVPLAVVTVVANVQIGFRDARCGTTCHYSPSPSSRCLDNVGDYKDVSEINKQVYVLMHSDTRSGENAQD